MVLVGFRYQSMHYMLPAVPVMAIVAMHGNPWVSGKRIWIPVALLLVLFVIKAKETEGAWRLDYTKGTTLAVAPQLNQYCRTLRDNELVFVLPDDEFYSSLLGLPFVRYVLLSQGLDKAKMPQHVWRLGLVMPAKQFLEEDKWKPVYWERLENWGLSNDKVMATVITLDSEEELVDMIRMSPRCDFLLPDAYRQLLEGVDLQDHQTNIAGAEHFFLLSLHSGLRTGPPSPLCMVDASQ